MNVLNKVTLQSLKKNRIRTIVTIIGIILSAAMICAVTTSVSSMQNYLLQYAIYNNGNWHGMTEGATLQNYRDITSSDEVENAVYGQLIGYAKIDSQNEEKPYLYVIGGDTENFFSVLPVHLTSGELPKNSSEIILPEHLAANGGLKYNIGDTITLELGNRTLDGYALGQNNPCYSYDSEKGESVINDELIEICSTRNYMVVGFFERLTYDIEPYTAPGYTALTVADKEFSEDIRFDVYFKMKNASKVYEFMGTMGLGDIYNTDVLLYSGISRYDSFTAMLVSLAAIIIGLIMFGSISLIYNAFSISVSERTRQFGLLSSLGATKKQLKKMVLFEALAVSAIGIPIGVLVGIGGIGVTLRIIGSKFLSLIGGSFNMPMRVCVSWQAVVIAAVVALVTVLISAWIPSKRATKVSAVEAIRQNADIKTNDKTIKTSKLTYKLFGLPGVLASKHYKRNKKKYRTTVISLFMSIVLFVSASAFSDYLMESVTGGMSGDQYDLWYMIDSEKSLNGKTMDDLLELFMSDKDVTNSVYAVQGSFSGSVSSEYLTDQFIKDALKLAASDNDESGMALNDAKQIYGYLYFINDTEFKELLAQYKLKESDYYNAEKPLGIAIDTNIQFDADKQKYVTIDTLKGDVSEITCSKARDIDACYTLRSEKTITEKPFYISKTTPSHLMMIYPKSMMEQVLPEEEGIRKYFQCVFYLKSDNHAASYDNLEDALTENGFDSSLFLDYAENVESSRNVVMIIQVFAYGFIVLISLIAAANVFNTISTNINLRRREFAMLKSVGMTGKGFNRMMNYECLLYGSKALLLGIPVSAGVTYLIYMAISEGFETSYHLPWIAIGIAVISVFVVVFATMLYSMSKIRKDNPIDALKNENL